MNFEKMEITSYELSRNFFDWSFENPDLISPNHVALYFFMIEHCNRLGWKEKFGLPTIMAKEAIGIKNYRTYYKTLNDLIDFGFIELVEKSKNQHSANVCAFVKNAKAHTKAYDKARLKHIQKQGLSTVDINKQYNHITINNKPYNLENLFFWAKPFFSELYFSENVYQIFVELIQLNYSIDDIKTAIAWARGDPFWTTNFLSPGKLIKKNKDGVRYIDTFLAKSLNGQNLQNGKNGNGASWGEITDIIKNTFGAP
jgi:hypothetical protein